MKKCFAFILLLCHMNTSMFLPQVAEDDVYDANGNQEDDINSVVEYFRVALGYDHTADDEDDDSGQNFHMAKTVDYFYQQPCIIITKKETSQSSCQKFPGYIVKKIPSVSFDILIPPPKVA